MTKQNPYLIPKENYQKIEEVREIESKIPSFEEFMKSYESDGSLNYDDLSSGGEVRGYGPMPRHQCQLQIQKQLPESAYILFVETMAWLEKYVELTYKNGFSDWENPKRNIYEYSKRIEETFLNQLHLLEGILKNDASPEFRWELKQEFNKWIKAAGIDLNNCPEKLKYFLFEINEVLEGGGKLERETTFFGHDETSEMFSRFQSPLENSKICSQGCFQQWTNSQIFQDIANIPQNWRLDEIPIEIDSFGRIKKQESVLIHRSARGDGFDPEGKLDFTNNPIYRASRFNEEEIKEINRTLNISSDFLGSERSYEPLFKKREHSQTSWQMMVSPHGEQESFTSASYTKYQGSVESGRSIRVNKKTGIKGFQHLIHTGNDWADRNDAPTKRGKLWDGGLSVYDDNDRLQFASVTTSAGGNAGIGGLIASGGADYSTLRIGDDNSEMKFLSGSVGGEIGIGPGGFVAGYSLSADVASVRAGGFQANVGYDAGSGVSFGAGGVEAKVAGLGISIGKKMGISTPFGGVSIDLGESCVVQ